MLTNLLILAVVIGVLTLIGQQYSDKYSKDNESFRKLFHVMHALTLAGLAFVVPLKWIVALEVLFFVSMIITRYLVFNKNQVLKWVSYMSRAYKVGRISYGEFFYPVSVILATILADTKWEFAAAVLILGLADTAAAFIGKKYGKRTSYKILGQRKSLIGSLAFFVVSFGIIALFANITPSLAPINLGFITMVALFVTASENAGVYGSDNLLIPVVSVVLLNAM